MVQKAFLEVDEGGTEATAVSTSEMEDSFSGSRTIDFRCDHPFLFFIRDKETGMILFSGRVVNPTGETKLLVTRKIVFQLVAQNH